MSDTPETITGAEAWWEVKRPEILPNPVPHYDTDCSVHPEQVRLSFGDGSTAIYDLRMTDIPHPVIMRNCEIIKKWKNGYINKPMARRRRRG